MLEIKMETSSPKNFKDILSLNDQIGGRVDPLIIPAVEGLIGLGFETWYSCQGHNKSSRIDGNEKFPFIIIRTDSNPQKINFRLKHLVDFYNRNVQTANKVNLSVNENVDLAEISFGSKKKGKRGTPEKLISSQNDSVVFGQFCRALALGMKEGQIMSHILLLVPLRENIFPKGYGKKVHESGKRFEQDYNMLMQTLSETSHAFEMVNTGMGL